MPIRFPCPWCGAKLSAPETTVGRSTRCPHCHDPVVVPNNGVVAATPIGVSPPIAQQDEQDLIAKPVDEELPAQAFENPNDNSLIERPPFTTGGLEQATPQWEPREPWYYGYLWVCAAIVLTIDVVGFLLGFVVCMVGLILAILSKDGRTPGLALLGGAGTITLVILMPSLIVTAFWSATIMLFVDLARNVRAMRYRR